MTTIVDVGHMFGLPIASVFSEGPARVLSPYDAEELNSALLTADLVGFGGGEDIHPQLYGSKNVASAVGHSPSHRDWIEAGVFRYCVEHAIPMFGICRGAQLLCAMSGGKLVQDVAGHGGTHTIILNDGSALPMTSTHHQMMYPWDTNHELLAWTVNRSKHYVHDIPNYVQHPRDPEVVWFEHTGALAVQGHPEWMNPKSDTVLQVRRWIREYLYIKV